MPLNAHFDLVVFLIGQLWLDYERVGDNVQNPYSQLFVALLSGGVGKYRRNIFSNGSVRYSS